MAIPPRLAPLLAQFDFARERLAARLAGPEGTAGMVCASRSRP